MKTTAAIAKTIRKNLKAELGVNSRQVSVRSDVYSMGATIRIVVKDADVNLDAVKAIANKFAEVRRDEATGEILNGGNLFVTCEYSAEALSLMTECALHRLGDLDKVEAQTIVNVLGVDVWEHPQSGLVLSGCGPYGCHLTCWNRETAARVIAEAVLCGRVCDDMDDEVEPASDQAEFAAWLGYAV